MRPATLLLALAASACSSEQIYNASSEWRAQQCGKLPLQEQADCQHQARASYAQMQKSRGAAQEPKN